MIEPASIFKTTFEEKSFKRENIFRVFSIKKLQSQNQRVGGG